MLAGMAEDSCLPQPNQGQSDKNEQRKQHQQLIDNQPDEVSRALVLAAAPVLTNPAFSAQRRVEKNKTEYAMRVKKQKDQHYQYQGAQRDPRQQLAEHAPVRSRIQ